MWVGRFSFIQVGLFSFGWFGLVSERIQKQDLYPESKAGTMYKLKDQSEKKHLQTGTLAN